MDPAFEAAIIECLDALERGETVEGLLAQYPQFADDLQPILETASSLAGVKVAHSLEAQAKSRQLLLAQAATLRTGNEGPGWFAIWFRRMAIALVPLVFIIAFAFTGVLYASSDALPGDALYETKRASENLRLTLTTDPMKREALREQFEIERILEIERLLESGRETVVTFRGAIEAITDDTWSIAGLRTLVNDATVIRGQPVIGRIAWVEAQVVNGQLTAMAVTIQFVPDTMPGPSPTPDSRPTATLVPQLRGSDVPTPTNTAIPTVTPSVETPRLETTPPSISEDIDQPATSTPTPMPNPPSNDDDDKNDNEDDDTNDNDDANVNDNDDNSNDNDDDDVNDNDDNSNDNDRDNDNDNSNDNDDDNESNANNNDNDDEKNENDDTNENDDRRDNENDNSKDRN